MYHKYPDDIESKGSVARIENVQAERIKDGLLRFTEGIRRGIERTHYCEEGLREYLV